VTAGGGLAQVPDLPGGGISRGRTSALRRLGGDTVLLMMIGVLPQAARSPLSCMGPMLPYCRRSQTKTTLWNRVDRAEGREGPCCIYGVRFRRPLLRAVPRPPRRNNAPRSVTARAEQVAAAPAAAPRCIAVPRRSWVVAAQPASGNRRPTPGHELRLPPLDQLDQPGHPLGEDLVWRRWSCAAAVPSTMRPSPTSSFPCALRRRDLVCAGQGGETRRPAVGERSLPHVGGCMARNGRRDIRSSRRFCRLREALIRRRPARHESALVDQFAHSVTAAEPCARLSTHITTNQSKNCTYD
jgi:hypothetical protein